MIVNVTKARVVAPYTLELEFNNGAKKQVNLWPDLYGPIFEPLRDPEYFARAYVNPATRTVEWPNGADFAPEFLFDYAPASKAQAFRLMAETDYYRLQGIAVGFGTGTKSATVGESSPVMGEAPGNILDTALSHVTPVPEVFVRYFVEIELSASRNAQATVEYFAEPAIAGATSYRAWSKYAETRLDCPVQ